MAQYDKSTENFMKAVAPPTNEEEQRNLTSIARKGLFLAKSIASPRPVAGAASAIFGQATRKAMDEMLTKEGGLAPLKLYSYLNKSYGSDWHDWEPETIWKTLREDDGIESVPEIKNMIQAFQVLTNTNYAHEAWQVFENVAHALNQNAVDFGEVQPLELDEIALAISIINKIRPKKLEEDKIWDRYPEDVRPDHGFATEVWSYVAASAKNSGVVLLPPELFGGSGRPQNVLDNKLGNDLNLKREVIKNLQSNKGKVVLEVQIQLGRLKEIRDYLEENHG